MSAQIIRLPGRESESEPDILKQAIAAKFGDEIALTGRDLAKGFDLLDQRAREHEGDDYPATTPGELDSPLGRWGLLERWMHGSSRRTGCVLGALLLIILAAASVAP